MTAKQYLKQIDLINGRIKRCEARISSLRDTLTTLSAVKYDGIKVQTSGTNTNEELTLEMIALEEEMKAYVVQLEQKKSEITKMLHTINYEDGENVLYLRWIEQLDFYEIADSIPCSLRHVHRIHSMALHLLTEKLSHDVT